MVPLTSARRWPSSCSAFVPIIIVYLFCQKYIIKGVAAGAVKG